MARLGRLAPVFAALAIVGAACGGGTADSSSAPDAQNSEVTEFASDDGVVAVEVPAGAAPDGFVGTVMQSDAPTSTAGDTTAILVYELGPDGTEFEEPVMVTFRISPSLGRFDPSAGLPVGAVAIGDDAEGFEPLGSMKSSLDGDTLVLEGTTTHFTEARVYIFDEGSIALVVEPPGLVKSVESLFDARIDDNAFQGSIGRIDYSVEGPLEIFSEQGEEATIECVREGEGKIHATVFGVLDWSLWEVAAAIFTGDAADWLGTPSLTIECVEDTDTSVPEPPAEEPPVTGHDGPPGDQTDEDTKQVEEGEGEPAGDIEQIQHEETDAGVNCFVIDVYGDGKQVAKDASWFDIIIEVDETDGGEWRANVTFGLGDDPFTDRGVRFGPNGPGRPVLEGATTSARWTDSDTLEVCVDGGGTNLTVESFQIDVGVRLSNGDTYWDHATGIGSS